jgi:hypothetical protein
MTWDLANKFIVLIIIQLVMFLIMLALMVRWFGGACL